MARPAGLVSPYMASRSLLLWRDIGLEAGERGCNPLREREDQDQYRYRLAPPPAMPCRPLTPWGLPPPNPCRSNPKGMAATDPSAHPELQCNIYMMLHCTWHKRCFWCCLCSATAASKCLVPGNGISGTWHMPYMCHVPMCQFTVHGMRPDWLHGAGEKREPPCH